VSCCTSKSPSAGLTWIRISRRYPASVVGRRPATATVAIQSSRYSLNVTRRGRTYDPCCRSASASLSAVCASFFVRKPRLRTCCRRPFDRPTSNTNPHVLPVFLMLPVLLTRASSASRVGRMPSSPRQTSVRRKTEDLTRVRTLVCTDPSGHRVVTVWSRRPRISAENGEHRRTTNNAKTPSEQAVCLLVTPSRRAISTPHNPSVAGSIPAGPTSAWRGLVEAGRFGFGDPQLSSKKV
jgi:hypothetical protein